MATPHDVIIIGAGLAGLACAGRIIEQGRTCTVLEASDGVGGRVRTDRIGGFLLDRGFQVFQTAYPESQRVLDFPALNLSSYHPGAIIRFAGRFHRVSDPSRQPLDAIRSILTPIGTLEDKLKMAWLGGKLRTIAEPRLSDQKPERTTYEELVRMGLSQDIIERFFKPFLGGVFLDADLKTSSRMFDFIMSVFARGDSTLPAEGMGAIPNQLAARLPAGSVRLNSPVTAVEQGRVVLESGESITGQQVVVATDASTAAKLVPGTVPRQFNGTTCLYYSASRPPITGPFLVLNGDGSGPINNLSVPSEVSRTYAPHGQSLVSVSLLGCPGQDDAHLEKTVRDQLTDWFGPSVGEWGLIRSYRIPYAQPVQEPGFSSVYRTPSPLRPDIYLCGDHQETSTIEGAILSGRKTADAICRPGDG